MVEEEYVCPNCGSGLDIKGNRNIKGRPLRLEVRTRVEAEPNFKMECPNCKVGVYGYFG
jgi:predicted RNA-binding Zn-ribbon protein involved in translation (DUF1610 family)